MAIINFLNIIWNFFVIDYSIWSILDMIYQLLASATENFLFYHNSNRIVASINS